MKNSRSSSRSNNGFAALKMIRASFCGANFAINIVSDSSMAQPITPAAEARYGKPDFAQSSCCLLLLSGFSATAQDIEVSVDRYELARGETLTYTIRVFEQRQGMQLDLTPLPKISMFWAPGHRVRSARLTDPWNPGLITSSRCSLSTEGDLEIPPLTINNARTDPITVSVVNQGPRSNQSSEELF